MSEPDSRVALQEDAPLFIARIVCAVARPCLLAAIFSLVLSNASLGQSTQKRAFGEWEATADRDLMTDSTSSSEATVGDAAQLTLECKQGRISAVYFTVDDRYGDSATTIRLRFDARPPTAAARWTRTPVMTDEERKTAQEGQTSTDPQLRQMARTLATANYFFYFTKFGAEARRFVDKLSVASELRVEFAPGNNAQREPFQAAFEVSGLREALKWMRCKT